MNMFFRNTLFSALFIFSSTSFFAQTPLSEATREAEVLPLWPGCTHEMNDCTKDKLNEFINSHIKVPTSAKAQAAGGVVLVEFVIEKNGSIGEVSALHDPGLGLGEEAVRVVKSMVSEKIKWQPARDKGKKIAFRYMTPVSFNLARPIEEKKVVVSEPIVTPDVYDVVEVVPRYAGCEISTADTIDCTFIHMIRHIQTNLTYPDSALRLGVQGPVVVEFIIAPDGVVSSPNVRQGLGHGLDEEAVRIITLMPAWQPGLQGGKAVPVRMVVPILFQIPKPDKE